MIKLASSSTCTGCMACIDSCSHNALTFSQDKNGFIKIDMNRNLCVRCGLCAKTCPIINPIKPVNDEFACFSAWSNDSELRKHSASGGFFATVAKYFLSNGGVVYGASIDGFDVRHIRVDSKEDLNRIQGSKYQPSILRGIYKLVRKDLKSGKKVLFSGLGCQISGLYNFLGKSDVSMLYTIDTICGGVPSLIPMKFLQASGRYRKIISFRDKTTGWKSVGFQYRLLMEDINGNITDRLEPNLVLSSFNSILCKKESCLDCQFNGLERTSDCTIGDFWGITEYDAQEYEGISAVIVHSNKFLRLLDDIDVTLNEVAWEEIARNNPKLWFGKTPMIRHFIQRKLLLKAVRNNDVDKFNRIQSSRLASIESIVYTRIMSIIKHKKYNALKKHYS